MKVGDLVRMKKGYSAPGVVIRIDKDFHGANQAFKTHPVARGHAIHEKRSPEFIAPTMKGIRDRVLIFWSDNQGYSYEESVVLEVISEVG